MIEHDFGIFCHLDSKTLYDCQVANFDRKIFRDFLFECFDMNEELFLDRIFKMFNPDMDTTITR